MDRYLEAYQTVTGKVPPVAAANLTPLFDQMQAGQVVPPRGQQAVELGFTAHTFNDREENPAMYDYYQWVKTHVITGPINELTAKIIGMAFTSANIIESNLPQPLTLNPWQIAQLETALITAKQAVIVENNGIFIWLAHRHPDWPLINQSGNDFNESSVQMIQKIEQAGVALTYLGDLDSTGIRIAAQLFAALKQTPVDQFMALQTPQRVVQWLSLYGKVSSERTRSVKLEPQLFQEEANSIHVLGRFVEQEQLIESYEQLIADWLA